MTYEVEGVSRQQLMTEPRYRPTLILQRLACPRLPPNPAPGEPGHDPSLSFVNPYLTIDYVEDVHINYAADYDAQGRTVPDPISDRASQGRNQPWAAAEVQQVITRRSTAPPSEPRHTFFQANDGRRPRFDWLVHLNREVISPMELLQVSTFKPHELTQQFFVNGQACQHRALWSDQKQLEASRVYRVFEYFKCHDRSQGMLGYTPATTVRSFQLVGPGRALIVPQVMSGVGPRNAPWGPKWLMKTGTVISIGSGDQQELVEVAGSPDNYQTSFFIDCVKSHQPGEPIIVVYAHERVPGRINLNTVWDEETLQALCDAQPGNQFTTADVHHLFQQLLKSRTPLGWPGPNDRPFRGMAQGLTPPGLQYPQGCGIEDTFLRSAPAAAAGCSRFPPRGTIPICRTNCSPRSSTRSPRAATSSPSG